MSSTNQRDESSRIAQTNPRRALQIAQQIGDPWFRCQALASAAMFLPAERQGSVIDEAFAAANQLAEPNRVVTVSSWPLKALALLDNTERVQSEGERLLAAIAAEQSPVRRADALRFLLGATATVNAPVALRIAALFGDSCVQTLQNGKRNRKGEYLLEEAIPVIARLDPVLAQSLITRLPRSRAARSSSAIEATREKSIEAIFPWPPLRAASFLPLRKAATGPQ